MINSRYWPRHLPVCIGMAIGLSGHMAFAAEPSNAEPKASPMGVLTDTIEPSATLPPSTVEVTALDTQSAPVAGAHIELTRDRQSISEGNSSSKWQGTTDSAGHVRFNDIPTGRDTQFRVVATDNGARYGTRPFAVDPGTGTKVLFHVYPVVKSLREALVAGRTFVFVEPRDDVLAIEVMQQFHNLGQTVLAADGLALKLPNKWKAFAATPTDTDLTVVKTADGVSMVGSIAPGQHSVAFTYQIPTANQARVELALDLWPNTAEVQVATLARPGLELEVEGFPNATVVQGNGRQPLLTTAQSFTQNARPPEDVRLNVSGLPVIGPGRWVASILAALLALGSLLTSFRRRQSASDDTSPAEARSRILKELAALEQARQGGLVGAETYTDTKEVLLAAFVRVERMSVSQ